MQTGEVRKLSIPAKEAYPDGFADWGIPAGGDLVFEIEVLKIKPHWGKAAKAKKAAEEAARSARKAAKAAAKAPPPAAAGGAGGACSVWPQCEPSPRSVDELLRCGFCPGPPAACKRCLSVLHRKSAFVNG
jgi:hypothetical protein